MSRVRILPESLSNKIAAGEVVERPASVVKELVENSLDAGSRRIRVEIEQGGRKLIQVSDDGCGMGSDDALLCLERYATSKIRRDEDLFSISTLGFRGEALPSIAAVSRFTLVTRDGSSDTAVKIEVNGGRICNVRQVGAAKGTVVTVADLFFNTPARRKFLKRIETEMSHIADTVVALALARCRVSFELIHNGRRVRRFGRCGRRGQRVLQALGPVFEGEPIPVQGADGDLRLDGWLGRPSVLRSTSRSIFVLVNGRRVFDRLVQHAVFEGYSGRLLKGRYPTAVLYLDLPGDQVDVNVHPTKHEVRFADQRRVHDLIRARVAEALAHWDRPRWQAPVSRAADDAVGRQPRYPEKPVARPLMVAEDRHGKHGENRLVEKDRLSEDKSANGSGPAESGSLWQEGRGRFGNLEIIGQFGGSYILCQAKNELIMIDQHAACERIAFEALKKSVLSGKPESQRLLVPETLELGFNEARILKELAGPLESWGLEIEPFGGTSFVIKAYPCLLDPAQLRSTVVELIEEAAETGVGSNLEKAIERCLMVMACHNSLRAHQRLNREQMEQILTRLDGCDDPCHCPHGRPTFVRWSLQELEKAFGRSA